MEHIYTSSRRKRRWLDSSSFRGETGGKRRCPRPINGERLGGAGLKNPWEGRGGPKCMLGRRDTSRNESHGVGNRIYRVLRSCITIPGEFTARSRAHWVKIDEEQPRSRILGETLNFENTKRFSPPDLLVS